MGDGLWVMDDGEGGFGMGKGRSLYLIRRLVLVAAVFAGSTAWAGSMQVTDRDGAGRPDPATLGGFLERLSAEGGFEIYLDERLRDRPVDAAVRFEKDPESALRRLASRYSHAFSYAGPSKAESRIREVWLFTEGDPGGIDFWVYSGKPTGGGNPEGERAGPAAALTGDTGRTIKGKDLLKKGIRFTRGPLGTPVLDPRRGHGRPDYRPTVRQMRRAREEADRRQQVERIRRFQVRRNRLKRRHEIRVRAARARDEALSPFSVDIGSRMTKQ